MKFFTKCGILCYFKPIMKYLIRKFKVGNDATLG